MKKNRYDNFVKASTSSELGNKPPKLSGNQAKEIYLEEIKDATNSSYCTKQSKTGRKVTNRSPKLVDISRQDLFISVQNNDVNKLRSILDSCPSRVNTIDDYGWSLLMIACQANSVGAVKELLKRGIDTSVRDKAGNSATNLVIKNKNLEIADLLISHRNNNPRTSDNCEPPRKVQIAKAKTRPKEAYMCNICNDNFPDEEEHLASTVHNICASKDKKIPTNYVIPQTNKGYQLMLRVGWDRESGLGRDGSGKKYPIKAVQKKDRKGLGHGKKSLEKSKVVETPPTSKLVIRKRTNEQHMEIHFRREFY